MPTLNEAVRLHDAGDLAAAEQAYRALLDREPDHAEALARYGFLLAQRGDHAGAARYLGKAVEHDAKQPSFLYYLAISELHLSQKAVAIGHLRQALALQPAYSDALCALGDLMLSVGDLPRLREQCQATLLHHPNHAEALLYMGLGSEVAGQLVEARSWLEQAVSAKPGLLRANMALGGIQVKLGNDAAAADCFLKVATMQPRYIPAHYQAGECLLRLKRFEEAVDRFQEVLRLDPHNAGAYAWLADIHEKTNRLTEAESFVYKALAIDPFHPNALRLKATLWRRAGRVHEALEVLKGVRIPKDDLRVANAIRFELGKLYDRVGEPDLAFAEFAAGNQLLVAALGFDLGKKKMYMDLVRNQRKIFTKAFVSDWTPGVSPPEASSPVFLIGFPRSGTTLLDQILDSHPDINVVEEKGLVVSAFSKAVKRRDGWPEVYARLTADELREIQDDYFKAADEYIDRTTGSVLIDKLPLNIVYVGYIQRLFPEAKFILALRHPCDCTLSCFMQAFGLNEAMAWFTNMEDATTLYAEVMGLWRHFLEVLPITYHAIRYEDVVQDMEGEVKRLLAFLGLSWDEKVLEYNKHARSRKLINTPSYSQVTEKLYTRARYRWQQYDRQLEPYMARLRPYIEFFGYD